MSAHTEHHTALVCWTLMGRDVDQRPSGEAPVEHRERESASRTEKDLSKEGKGKEKKRGSMVVIWWWWLVVLCECRSTWHPNRNKQLVTALKKLATPARPAWCCCCCLPARETRLRATGKADGAPRRGVGQSQPADFGPTRPLGRPKYERSNPTLAAGAAARPQQALQASFLPSSTSTTSTTSTTSSSSSTTTTIAIAIAVHAHLLAVPQHTHTHIHI